MRIEVNNRQTLYQTDRRKIVRLVEFFMQCAHRLDPLRQWESVSVALVDDDEIAVVNQQHLGHEGATDVITFHLTPLPGEKDGDTGDIVVNVERSVELINPESSQTRLPRGWSASHELALYLAHGCDHLAGQNDATPEDRRQMRRRELRWVRRADGLKLLTSLVTE